ncbi:MAG: toxin HipA [Bacteroidetes bacterium GWF2_38_335]|nr:MAG: toxin HipA [Bacteroidetes bacterium GWF2_38_335]OFY78359.1 MAG: toxin HipA [Bacteroidetes bacterium RIFOXYA12_FULL_38_20]HBS87444.1 toxin HipA [Bacteroidales bacterium]
MATNINKQILVFAHWNEMEAPISLGILNAQRLRGKEIFSFEYDKNWLNSKYSLSLDPNLGLFQGKQFAPELKQNFGLFLDSSPDRWGRMLMRRREAAIAKKEKRDEQTLFESDYLLGVYDGHRLGGLRFKISENGDFLNNHREMASPPWTSLRELEHACLQLEREDAIDDPEYFHWLSILFSPGSSLGGARPKAGVLDEKGNLWIAKFPSVNDEIDTGAWEMVLHELAKKAGIIVPDARIMRFSGKHHTYLSKRFDRIGRNKRVHFASAMTLLGYNDGADAAQGVSYLEFVEFILQHSYDSKWDLEQLWRRIVFNILVSNTDDHLRNHGWLLTEKGWKLSPAYDMNPNQFGTGLSLNITENNNSLDAALALDVAGYFKLNPGSANAILNEMTSAISEWKTIAKHYKISKSEIDLMKKAFNNPGFQAGDIHNEKRNRRP